MKPSILHISTANDKRGGEQQLMYLLEEHIEKVEQHVICRPGSPVSRFCEQKGIAFTELDKRSGLDMKLAKGVARIADSCSSHLTHTHDAHGHSAAVLARRLFGMRSGIIAHRRVDFHIHSSFSRHFKYAYSGVLKIICVSKAIEDIMARDLGDRSKLITIHSGIDVDSISRTRTGRLRQELKLKEGQYLIGQVAAHAPHKDLFTFIRTAKVLCKSRTDVHFVSIGDGPQSAEIKAFASQEGMDEHITFVGYRNDVKEIIPDLDVFFMSSETEGLGTSVLDAMAAKVPVVATRAGGIPEMIKDGVNGRLADVKDPGGLALCLESVLESDCNAMIEAAYETVQGFSKQATAKRTLDVYRELLP